MEQHVLLVVHDEAAKVAGGDRLGRGRNHVPYRHDREDWPSGHVVRRLRVRLHGRVGHLMPVPAPCATDRREVEAHVARPGIEFQAT